MLLYNKIIKKEGGGYELRNEKYRELYRDRYLVLVIKAFLEEKINTTCDDVIM